MSAELHQFYREQFLALRLREHGINIGDGVTTPEIRRDRARKAIVDADLADVIHKALARTPTQRFASITEFRLALIRAVQGD